MSKSSERSIKTGGRTAMLQRTQTGIVTARLLVVRVGMDKKRWREKHI